MWEVAIFTGLWYWICKTDVGYAITHAIRQPLFASVLIGLIMGDVTQAVIIGAAIQILYIGLVAAGSNLPADDCLAGLIATARLKHRSLAEAGYRYRGAGRGNGRLSRSIQENRQRRLRAYGG